MADSFQLLTVLGNGSKSVEAHFRYPLGAYQSGSTLVLWDYVKDKKRNIPLLPNQWCHHLFFAKDGLTILGLWLGQGGQPTLTCWRVADGEKIAEQTLADTSGSGVVSAFSTETHILVVLQKGCVGFASVVQWDSRTLRHQKLAHGHVGNTEDIITIQMLPNNSSFVALSQSEIKFFSFAQDMTVRLVSRVLFKQKIDDLAVFDDVLYLLSAKGKVLCIDYDGNLLATVGYPGVRFTALQISTTNGQMILGSSVGDLFLYSLARLEFKKKIECPKVAAGDSTGATQNNGEQIYKLSFGMNLDYVFSTFLDSSVGIAHLPTNTYVGLRMGHLLPVKTIARAPTLQVPAVLASKLIDPDRHAVSNALSFVSVSQDGSFLSWPITGSPFRTEVYSASDQAPYEMSGLPNVPETFQPAPYLATSETPKQKIALTAAAFRKTSNSIALDGRLNGSYELLAGVQDGALFLYTYEDNRTPPRASFTISQQANMEMNKNSSKSPERFSWRLALVRPPPPELREWQIGSKSMQMNVSNAGVAIKAMDEDADDLEVDPSRDAAVHAAVGSVAAAAPPTLSRGRDAGGSNGVITGTSAASSSTSLPYCCDLQFLPLDPPSEYYAQANGIAQMNPATAAASGGQQGAQSYVLATYTNGFSELLSYPELRQQLVLQNPPPASSPSAAGGGGKSSSSTKCSAKFVRHPDYEKRVYDQNLYILAQSAANNNELILFEVYRLGSGFAKSTLKTFEVTATVPATQTMSAGGFGSGAQSTRGRAGSAGAALAATRSDTPCITDFSVHPSKLFVVITAVIPQEDSPQLSIYDLWSGEKRHQMPLFASVLITSLAPLRPSICCDPSGAFVFAASTPAWVGSFEQAARDLAEVPTSTALVTDSCQLVNPMQEELRKATTGARNNQNVRLPPTASVLCVIDFRKATLLHQMSLDICAFSLGSFETKIHDPTQLLIGSHDGTISIWSPPESVRRVIRTWLKEAEQASLQAVSDVPQSLENAIESFWFYSQRHLPVQWSEEKYRPVEAANGPPPQRDRAGSSNFLLPSEDYSRLNFGTSSAAVGRNDELNFGLNTDEDVVVQAREGRLGHMVDGPASTSPLKASNAGPGGVGPLPGSASSSSANVNFRQVNLEEPFSMGGTASRRSRNSSFDVGPFAAGGNFSGSMNINQQLVAPAPGSSGNLFRQSQQGRKLLGDGNPPELVYNYENEVGGQDGDNFDLVEDMFAGFESFERNVVGLGPEDDDSDEEY
ncbi:unnamed protein product [Amoebophrya sp. A120]|nr:unnamed protein product [Amoebophrya sp. A120]|eukprot:GSA120T00021260001.1